MIEQEHQLQAAVKTSRTYEQYLTHIEELLAQNKTTGENHSPSMIEYTVLNMKRMKKWNKIASIRPSLSEKIQQINEIQHWVVISEGWCGDAAQNLPIIAKVAALNPNIQLQIVLRDESPELIEQYLTNGAKSIPKLILLNTDMSEEIGVWGPRPQPVQEMLYRQKATGNFSYEQFAIEAHTWYAKDRGQTLQIELEELLAN